MLRDPYDLSFLPGARIAKERDLEEALLADIVKFMLELGGGLTFAGQRKRLENEPIGVAVGLPTSSAVPPGGMVGREIRNGRGVPHRTRATRPAS